jgi:uncharacterized protein YodC (DUF2158 family)
MASLGSWTWDKDHELVGRVVVLNSGGPLMTITGVNFDPQDSETIAEYAVRWHDADLRLVQEIVNVRWVELLTPEDAALGEPEASP